MCQERRGPSHSGAHCCTSDALRLHWLARLNYLKPSGSTPLPEASIVLPCRSFGQCMQLQDSGSPPYVRVLECCRCVADSSTVVDRS